MEAQERIAIRELIQIGAIPPGIPTKERLSKSLVLQPQSPLVLFPTHFAGSWTLHHHPYQAREKFALSSKHTLKLDPEFLKQKETCENLVACKEQNTAATTAQTERDRQEGFLPLNCCTGVRKPAVLCPRPLFSNRMPFCDVAFNNMLCS